MLYEGREIVFNRWSARHVDRQDPHFGWACIVYFGTFSVTRLIFPQLGLVVYLRPGDMVWFRGRDLIHEVPEWEGGDRNFLVHFTHESIWKMADISCTSDKATNIGD
ncbi:hypothetical protein K474DRAFT_1610449 [Panus rudis PR-1116 ss-1]|nr:hypothetical protein K474DRAFT_1610449 [Panus rudis PR-1116 ss-1]